MGSNYEMVRYTSILLPLAQSRKRRLEEAAAARGESLEFFILEAAEAEAERIGEWLSERGHSVDHPIYSLMTPDSHLPPGFRFDGEYQVATHRVAGELGWRDEPSQAWIDEVDRLIEEVEGLDALAAEAFQEEAIQNTRCSSRRTVRSVQVLNPIHGTVVDMSESGLGIETHGPFSVPETVQLSIGQAVASAKIRVQVRWCELIRTESYSNGDVVPIYRSGLEFLGH